MKKSVLLFVLIFTFFQACKSDNSSSSSDEIEMSESNLNLDDMEITGDEEVDLNVEMDKAIEEEELAKKLLVESKKKEVNEIAKVEDKNETKLVGKTEDQIKQEEQLKKEATKKLIDKSVNKGKSCEEILVEQEGLVDEFEKTSDRKLILKIAKQKNDPFFAECMKAEAFAKKVEELTVRLEELIYQE